MLTTTGHARSAHIDALSRMTPSPPGLGKPIEFNIPAGVSTVRGVKLPSRGSGVTVLVTMAPRQAKSTTSRYSSPNPNVPDAVKTGARSFNPRGWLGAISTASEEAAPASVFSPSRPGLGLSTLEATTGRLTSVFVETKA